MIMSNATAKPAPASLKLKRFLGRQVERLDLVMSMINRQWRSGHKLRSELAFWQDVLVMTREWYEGKRDWFGYAPPTLEQRTQQSSIPLANAVFTLHALHPTYLLKLGLKADHFAGQRLLEIGPGPMAPSLQFTGCEHHALDPLIDLYMRIGWPMYEYDMKCVRSEAEQMPYADGYFDAVMSVNALDHVDDFEKVAAEIERVCRPGGSIHLELEYHPPRTCEPQELNDQRVMKAFARTDMRVEYNRSKQEGFDLLGQSGQPIKTDERLVVWHGVRR
jgi:SAM-dependent methyltransferase